jgi:GT2 family glycosyltransferase
MLDSPDDRLYALSDAALEPLFHRPLRIGVESAWYGHVPFAGWIIQAGAPRVLVELGTHAGVSYSAFCEAVLRCRLPTRCFAVDTWKGDQHAGEFAEAVYRDFRYFHDHHFRNFSTTLRMTFDEASTQLPRACIDLLHIDGLHTYEAVRHDFETWRPLLSDRAVVLFHDTNERERDFGVWRLWHELRGRYPGFEFLHGRGLGVLAVGDNVPRQVAALCTVTDETTMAIIRHRFAMLGGRWQAEAELLLLAPRLQQLEQAEARLQALDAAGAADAIQELANLHQQVADLASERDAMLNSTLWRAAAPLRAVGNLLPSRVRHIARSVLRTGSAPFRRQPERTVQHPEPPIEPMLEPPIEPELEAERPATVANRVVFISGEPHTPGHTYRVIRQAQAAACAGFDAITMTIHEAPDRMAEIATAGVVVIWRTTWTDAVAQIVDVVRASGARLIFDVDDLMIRPELATVEVIDGIRSQHFDPQAVAAHFDNTRKVLQAADAGSCTTMELARHIRAAQKPAFVLPNGFDEAALAESRLAVRKRRAAAKDGVVYIGYAAGSRTHQRDFAQAADAVARVLSERPHCRLVLFEADDGVRPLLDLHEFPALEARAHQVEWRPMVTLDRLPVELARFGVNLAPLEVGNPFCEAKSELKFFEAALVGVPTIASPTGPLKRAIRHGTTGMLAATEEDWYSALQALIDDAEARRCMGRAAYLDVLWRFGPERRAQRLQAMLRQMASGTQGGAAGADAFALELARESAPPPSQPELPETETVFAFDRLDQAQVTVVIPLYNYAGYVTEALESVRAQTLDRIDLIVVDDASTDDSLAVARGWAEQNVDRFNRILVLRNHINAGLSRTRNAGFDAAETPCVLPLDADNRLLQECCAQTLHALRSSHAAFAYPRIRYFGGMSHVIGDLDFEPARLAGGNFVDAMALVRKSAWASAGGYAPIKYGWEDYDFWCRLAELGLTGVQVPEVLAEYRVHEASMLHTATDLAENKRQVIAELERRHAWLSIPYPE